MKLRLHTYKTSAAIKGDPPLIMNPCLMAEGQNSNLRSKKRVNQKVVSDTHEPLKTIVMPLRQSITHANLCPKQKPVPTKLLMRFRKCHKMFS